MDNSFALFAAVVLIAGAIIDWSLLGGAMTIGLSRILLHFIEYLSFWR
jgi:hypothetical protein